MKSDKIDNLLDILTTISHQLSDVILLLSYPKLYEPVATPQQQYNTTIESK